MTIDEAYQRASRLMERMRELEQECTLLEARHGEVVARMRDVNMEMARLLRQALAIDGDDVIGGIG